MRELAVTHPSRITASHGRPGQHHRKHTILAGNRNLVCSASSGGGYLKKLSKSSTCSQHNSPKVKQENASGRSEPPALQKQTCNGQHILLAPLQGHVKANEEVQIARCNNMQHFEVSTTPIEGGRSFAITSSSNQMGERPGTSSAPPARKSKGPHSDRRTDIKVHSDSAKTEQKRKGGRRQTLSESCNIPDQPFKVEVIDLPASATTAASSAAAASGLLSASAAAAVSGLASSPAASASASGLLSSPPPPPSPPPPAAAVAVAFGLLSSIPPPPPPSPPAAAAASASGLLSSPVAASASGLLSSPPPPAAAASGLPSSPAEAISTNLPVKDESDFGFEFSILSSTLASSLVQLKQSTENTQSLILHPAKEDSIEDVVRTKPFVASTKGVEAAATANERILRSRMEVSSEEVRNLAHGSRHISNQEKSSEHSASDWFPRSAIRSKVADSTLLPESHDLPIATATPSGRHAVIGDDSNTIFVKGMDATIPEGHQRAALMSVFSRHGKVVQVRIPVDRSGRAKGIALIVMENSVAKAQAASLDNVLVLGRYIRLDLNPGIERSIAVQKARNATGEQRWKTSTFNALRMDRNPGGGQASSKSIHQSGMRKHTEHLENGHKYYQSVDVMRRKELTSQVPHAHMPRVVREWEETGHYLPA
ncbi:hypothetical protein CEUSTIGMA_g7003.t1 [Chlamydomonas eustigma]|uniref:RRM domain-containing protein n=1 Tax=Chlamydomonas eustigma TaxID=1157962 RepID=A0A250X9M4_9CHLO|nr:hypothetical protein CEUSTIGMA_g7003.t1 [Chlamydomonas eustigma]|eukprot:GAX79562.1 hypothetical protein CEUSTIGMA_g7003.t1 [Chlamydomonas eustigma]